jgi:hypothetical protein
LSIKDIVIGFTGFILMAFLYAPLFALIEKLTGSFSDFDQFVFTGLFYVALFVVGYWLVRLFDIGGEENNDNIKREFHDYM